MRTIDVKVPGQAGYPVIVGGGALDQLTDLIPSGARRAAIITQTGVPPIDLPSGLDACPVIVPDGEAAKTMTTVESVCRTLAGEGFTRDDIVIGVGGGVVTDLAGFVAAVYHRGIRVIHVATTLLAQVDAAIGGKTGVNLPEGKNLVGAFWQPAGVICDTTTLNTLPAREMRSGLGEVAKYHFLGEVADGDLATQVADCVAIKAAVVMEDEREAGRRAILNYGHTLGHAIEVATTFEIRHGEAVAIGLVFAARLARRLGRIDDARVHEHRVVVGAYDLPTALPPIEPESLLALMQRDKKAREGLTLVLDGPRGVEPVIVDAAEVLEELESMGRER